MAIKISAAKKQILREKFAEDLHPRHPAGSSSGGQFMSKDNPITSTGSKIKDLSSGQTLISNDVGLNKAADAIAELVNVDRERAGQMAIAVNAFTRGHDQSIRKAQTKGKEYEYGNYDPATLMQTDEAKTGFDVVGAMDAFFDKAPKYKGQIYRGLRFDYEEDYELALSQMEEEDVFVLKAHSSFSHNYEVADTYTNTKTTEGRAILLHVASNKSGVGVGDISEYRSEYEVLASAGTAYKITDRRIEKRSGYKKGDCMHLYLEEVDPDGLKERRKELYSDAKFWSNR